MKQRQEIYCRLAESLATLFLPMAEVALLDAKKQIICLFNRLTNDELPYVEGAKPIKLLINKNQQAKLMIVPLEDEYLLRILVDITLFESLQIFLKHYLSKPTKNIELNSWQESVDQLINNYLLENKIALSALSTKDKRNIILIIQENELFRYPDATKYLANKLMVSRATIYNYLQQANQFSAIEVHQVDAFTDEPFSGNPAGVVLNADPLSDSIMKKIAREMNLSETSFLLNSNKADIKLRYFTPNGTEVKFCGHSTVGALYMLAHEQMLGINKPGRYELTIEAKIGVIPAIITLEIDQGVVIQYQAPKSELIVSKIKHAEIAEALGIPLTAINLQKPIMFEKNNQDLYFTINSLKELGDLHLDVKSAKHFAEKHNIVAFALLCKQTFQENNQIHMRCFAPAVGIAEDPFTGSVLGGLAEYVILHGLIDKKKKTICIEQGHFMARPGYVELKLVKDASPFVIAKARHFFSTKINL